MPHLPPRDVTLLILGDSAPQKAHLVRRFLGQEISAREAIWEDHNGKTQFQARSMYIDCQPTVVKVRNISDFEFFMQSDIAFFHRIDGCILVYRSDVPGSFDTARAWRKEYRLSARLKRNDPFPFLFLDCDGSGVADGDIVQFQKRHGNVMFREACLTSGEFVQAAFDALIRSAVKRQKIANKI
jgi:hypothetical protein